MARVSLTVVIFTAMLLAVSIAAIVAFVPTYQSGVRGVQDSVKVLRQNAMARIVNGVKLFFRVPSAQANTLQVAWEAGLNTTRDDETILKLICGVMRDEGELLTGVFLYTPNSIHGCDQRFGKPFAGTLFKPNTTSPVFPWDLEKGEFIQPMRKAFDIPWNITAYWLLLNDPNADRDRWMDAREGWNAVSIASAIGVFHPTTNELLGRFLLYLHPPRLGELLSNLGLSTNSRVVLVDATVRYVVANSWGEPTELLYSNWDDLSLPGNQRMRLNRLSDMSDPVISRVLPELGGEDGFYSINGSLSTTKFSGDDRVFVDVDTFRDKYMLNIKILLAMPEDDFLGEIRSQQRATIGGVVGALTGTLILSVVFAVLLGRPLKRLGHRMYLTASLQDEEADDPPSLLSEVAAMQAAYVAMKAELLRMKCFLPQSLLDQNDDDDDGDDEGSLAEKESQDLTPRAAAMNRSTKLNESGSVRSSQRSHTSRTSSRRTGNSSVAGGNLVGGFNMARTVHRRRVAMTAFNLVGFHRLADGANLSSLKQTQSAYLTMCTKHIRDNKGFVDHFHGDHVFASFNAVTQVASAGKRAVLASLALAKEVSETPLMPTFTAGVAVSIASVGNMGNDTMVRFNVIGDAYIQAEAMERLARSQHENAPDALRCAPNTLVVVTQEALQDIELEVEYEIFDIVATKGKPSLVAYVGGVRNMASDEWMYQLEASENRDVYGAANKAFRAVVLGEKGDATSLIESVPAEKKNITKRLTELAACCESEVLPCQKVEYRL